MLHTHTHLILSEHRFEHQSPKIMNQIWKMLIKNRNIGVQHWSSLKLYKSFKSQSPHLNVSLIESFVFFRFPLCFPHLPLSLSLLLLLVSKVTGAVWVNNGGNQQPGRDGPAVPPSLACFRRISIFSVLRGRGASARRSFLGHDPRPRRAQDFSVTQVNQLVKMSPNLCLWNYQIIPG